MAVSQKNQGTIDGGARRTAKAVGVPIRVTPTLDTSAYASGDLVADMTAITNAADAVGGSIVVDQITIYDKGDQTASAYTLVFGQASTSLGTLNSAPNISDANAAGAAAGAGLKVVPIAAADWVDIGGIKVATLRNLGLVLHAAAASRDLYVGVVNGAGTPTFGASDWVIDIEAA